MDGKQNDSARGDEMREAVRQRGGGLDQFAPAFVRAWCRVQNVVKNANNPHFGNDYADLAAVLDAIKPVFAEEGLAIYQSPGPIEGDKVTLTTMVLHTSGQYITSTLQIPVGGKFTAQSAGSAYTYARRYAAQAVAGIAPVDDDGQEASAPKKEPAKKAKTEPEPKFQGEDEDEGTYASQRDALLERIAAIKVGPMNKLAATAALEAVKEEVRALADDEVAKAFVAKKTEVRGSKS